MNFSRKGKVARLPDAIRQELNRRLNDGEQGKELAAWLNTLPEVQAIIRVQFRGKPIRPQNISEWKKGGYREWRTQQETLAAAERIGVQWKAEGCPPPAETMAKWTATRYALAARRIAATEGQEGWRLLRELCGDIVALRRGDLYARRLDLDRERQLLRNPAPEETKQNHPPEHNQRRRPPAN